MTFFRTKSTNVCACACAGCGNRTVCGTPKDPKSFDISLPKYVVHKCGDHGRVIGLVYTKCMGKSGRVPAYRIAVAGGGCHFWLCHECCAPDSNKYWQWSLEP